MFNDFLDYENEYKIKNFLIKGINDDIEKIKNNKKYNIEILDENIDDGGFITISVSEYTDIESIIDENPNVIIVGFVEDWTKYDVYVVLSEIGSNKIDKYDCVGFFDRHHDINWHDKCSVIDTRKEITMSYNGESHNSYYNFPFEKEWQLF